ncbi:MAG: efflux RND transporter periplasmic adaptor subunit [Deltaproteobacteria bacterium]|nr:efflux RND transporter periplasmic adaptor subunit [Deltaproteobacteria bacterium]
MVLVAMTALAGPGMALAKGKKPKSVTVPIEKPVPVQILKIKDRILPQKVEAIGRITPNRKLTITSQVPGIIANYTASQGDLVKRGQLLIRIDPIDYELAHEEAQANLTAVRAQVYSATKAFERSKNLLPRKVISRDNYEKAEAGYKAAMAQEARALVGIKIAEERLRKTKVYTPFSGVISMRYVETGQMIGAGVPLMNLVDLNQVRVKINLTEQDYIRIKRGDRAVVRVDAYPSLIFKGRIDRIAVTSDPRTNTFAVEVLLDNPDLVLKSGFSARVSLATRPLVNVILIPQSAILFRENGADVYVIDGNRKAVKKSVILGITIGDDIQVIDGLSPDDRLVVKGQNYLKIGARVSVKTQGGGK